jgi:hypothetical protein
VILDEFLKHIEKNIYPNAQLLSLFFCNLGDASDAWILVRPIF